MSILRIPSDIPYDSNIYLVTGDRPIIIDAGTGLDSDRVISRIKSSYPIEPVALVATHCHYDHCGGISDIVQAFGCEVYCGSRDQPILRSGDPVLSVADLFSGVLHPVDALPLENGAVISTGDHHLRIIETPGHTGGSICLYDDQSGSLISGDTLFPTGFGRTDFPGGSADAMRRSLSILSNIDIKGLFPGHGNVIESFDAALLARILSMAGV